MFEGLTPLPVWTPPKPAQCEGWTKSTWYRPNGARCSFAARFKSKDGHLFCAVHAKQEAIKTLKNVDGDGI
jgi:hypothetical protein